MALSTRRDFDKGPLKLTHDYPDKSWGNLKTGGRKKRVTPHDPRGSHHPSVHKGLNANHRFQGFPLKNFETANKVGSLRHSVETENPSLQLEKHHGVKHYFDTNRPKVFEEVHGLQYGSDGMPATVNPAVQRPFRDPFNERTSAEVRRFRQLQSDVEEDLQKCKAVKMQKNQQRDEEKKKDMDMLMKYNPWGRPGAGAPNKNADDLSPSKMDTGAKPSNEYTQEYGDYHTSFGRPGAGAPLRTDSGRLKAELKADQSIRFQDTVDGRKVYDMEVRYQKTGAEKVKYAQELDIQRQNNDLKQQEGKINELKTELDMLKHDPYGKPGAGAPNKTRSGLHDSIARRITLSLDIPELRRLQDKAADLRLLETDQARHKLMDNLNARHNSNFEFYDPWGKGAGHPKRDQYGQVARHLHSEKNTGIHTEDSPRVNYDEASLSLSFGGQGGGAPMQTESGHLKTRIPITMKRDEKGDTSIREEMPGKARAPPITLDDPELQVYDPFHQGQGRGGGGAPLRDSGGHIVTKMNARFNQEGGEQSKKQVAAREYMEDLQRGMDMQKLKRDMDQRKQKEGAGELASVMTGGQVGRPRYDPRTGALGNQHLPTTDVTREKLAARSLVTDQTPEYHTELERAAVERKRLHSLDKLKDVQQEKHHETVMSQLWGRPGGGAPNSHLPRAKLDNILYSPRNELFGGPLYHKQGLTLAAPAPHVHHRNTINGNAKNMYEFNAPQRRQPKKDYNLLPPYASEPAEVF